MKLLSQFKRGRLQPQIGKTRDDGNERKPPAQTNMEELHDTKINSALLNIPTTVAKPNDLIYATTTVVLEKLGYKIKIMNAECPL